MDRRRRNSPVVSGSFLRLQRLSASFERLADGRLAHSSDPQTILRAASALGAIGLPLCHRRFAGEDEERAEWAHALLVHLARDQELRARIVNELEALMRGTGAPDRARMRASALLAELGADLAEDESLADPEVPGPRTRRPFALCLRTAAEVASTGDHLLAQLSPDELVDLFDALIGSEPESALILLDELLVRDDLVEGCRHALRQHRAAVQLARAAPQRWRRRPRDAVSCRAAAHADGRGILLVSDRQPGCRPACRRSLCVLVARSGVLLDGRYAEDQTVEALERDLVAPLEREGFRLTTITMDTARDFLIQAARQAVLAGRALPRPFYLGRHLLGIRDEHLEGTARCTAAMDLAALLDRAIRLNAGEEPAAALPLLERYVADVPDDGEGHGQLGLCLLRLGDASAALVHLGRATWLAPDEPLHHWNTAAAAHRAGLMGTCYLALETYRKTRDVAPGAEERHLVAQRFAEEYARLAVLEHPGATPRAIASAEAARHAPTRSRRRQRG